VYVESEADRVVAMERYRTVVHELLGAPRVQAESPA
jgi:hypothetical protein